MHAKLLIPRLVLLSICLLIDFESSVPHAIPQSTISKGTTELAVTSSKIQSCSDMMRTCPLETIPRSLAPEGQSQTINIYRAGRVGKGLRKNLNDTLDFAFICFH